MVKREGMITFDASLRIEILDMFGISTDPDGYLIEKESPHYHIIEKGEWVNVKDFAGIMRDEKTGGVKIITSDIASMIELNDKLKGD